MGSDDLFKKRREARTQRKHEYKTTKANSYLIVTEGERTEPLYFKGMQKLIQEKVGGVVDVFDKDDFDDFDQAIQEGRCRPSQYDPGTMVHKLVESLKVYLE